MRVSQKASPFGSKSSEKSCSTSAKKRQSGCGLSGSRRRRSDKPALASVTKSDMRRLARKAGVKRIGLNTYAEARTALTIFLKNVLKDVGVITEGARRMTVTVPDVLLALKHNGRTLYGFGEINSLQQYTTRIKQPVKQDALQRAAALVQKRQQVSNSQQSTQHWSHTRQSSSPAGPSDIHSASRNMLRPEPAAETARSGVEGSAAPRIAEGSTAGAASQQGGAEQSEGQKPSSMDLVPATPEEPPETPSQPAQVPMSEEMRDHIQGSVGEYVAKVYQYDPPGSVYKVRDVHSWVASQYFQRKGLDSCSPEQLQTVLYALDEEGHVMISNDDHDLQIRFVM
ncbi:TPA: hypothetical protein ACH3X2_005669 [Trebouxia sp. C0005]